MRTICLLALLLCACPPAPPAPAEDLSHEDALPSGACRAELTCRMGICIAPGGFAGCGACQRPDPAELCDKDDDCRARGANLVCTSDPHDCLCGGGSLCRPGCTKDSCGEGQECGTDLRCAGKACTMDGDCPGHFVCSLSKRCERQGCRTSAECDGGYCVGGACQPAPGRCRLPSSRPQGEASRR